MTYIIIIIFFFEEGRNALCTVKGTSCPPGVWDSAAYAALPTKSPSPYLGALAQCIVIHYSGAFPLLTHRDSTSASPCRNLQHAPPHRISSSTCCGLALVSLPLCVQSPGSESIDLPPFSCASYRIPTRSWCGPPCLL